MQVSGQQPPERFPEIGTVLNPSFFFDGGNLLLGYEVARVAGGGIAALMFKNVIDFRTKPITVEGLSASEWPAQPWCFTEISGSDLQAHWHSLTPRFWTISFNDMLLEVLFTSVSLIGQTFSEIAPDRFLMRLVASFAGQSDD